MGTQWWQPTQPGPAISPSGEAYGGGGGSLPSQTSAIQYRDPVDALRAAHGRIGQAQYPDGYLGNIIDRRQDRLIPAIQNRLNHESYQRGVHKGSLISPQDYFWPAGGVTPDAGLEREAKARRIGSTLRVPRSSPTGNPVEVLAHEGKTSGLATPGDVGSKQQEAADAGVNSAANPIVIQDPIRVLHFQKMLPRYRSGTRPYTGGSGVT